MINRKKDYVVYYDDVIKKKSKIFCENSFDESSSKYWIIANMIYPIKIINISIKFFWNVYFKKKW